MRKPFLFIFAGAMIMIVVFALLTQSLFIVQRLASTKQASGQVAVQRGGKGAFEPVTLRTVIKTGDVLRAGADGQAEFRWLDGTRLKLTPNTLLTIKKVAYNTVKKSDRSEFRLSSGKVFIRIMKSLAPSSRFEVETPTAVAAVRGTIFSVAVENGKTQVKVYKGQVKVTSGAGQNNAQKLIEPGQAALSNEAGQLQTQAAANAAREFESQTSMVRPALEARLRPLGEGAAALVMGQTEAGNTVTVDGQKARVRGDGRFSLKVAVRPGREMVVVATDKHGATTSTSVALAPNVNASNAATASAPAG